MQIQNPLRMLLSTLMLAVLGCSTPPLGRAAGTSPDRVVESAPGSAYMQPVTMSLEPEQVHGCEYWVAPPPEGDDENPGTFDEPWASLDGAAANAPDAGCTVWVKDGLYTGFNRIERRFATPIVFKAANAYRAVLENSGLVVQVRGGRNLVFEGFEFRHSGPGANVLVVELQRRDHLWAENITFRNNIFHDSFNNDLLKIHNGSRFVLVENNVFYNQEGANQHIDINSATDVVVQDNILFNDFPGSGRPDASETNAFIVVKDSNGDSDGQLGSEQVVIQRNIFLNWQGRPGDRILKIGNDGKPYHEASRVWVLNNLFIGNSASVSGAPFGVSGAQNIGFINNTVVGDLPSGAYGFSLDTKGENPINEDIFFSNNIWADPTGTMGLSEPEAVPEFSDGSPEQTSNLSLDNNLYWNAGTDIPGGDLVSPLEHDPRRIVADPLLNPDHANVILPRWTGSSFLCGTTTIRDEFVRLAQTYGRIPPESAAIDLADGNYAPPDDILRQPRTALPDIGAYEAGGEVAPIVCPCCP